jgi:hypothetical protein
MARMDRFTWLSRFTRRHKTVVHNRVKRVKATLLRWVWWLDDSHNGSVKAFTRGEARHLIKVKLGIGSHGRVPLGVSLICAREG